MVDRKARDEFAQLLRHFVAGRVLNFDFDKHVFKSDWYKTWSVKDRVLEEVFDQMWFFYCEVRKHYLSGESALTKEDRRIVARHILFLHSDLEYEWDAAESQMTLWDRLMGKKPQQPLIPGDKRI